MARTTPGAVEAILADNYDGTTSLVPFIDTATVIIDRVVTCATRKSVTLTATEKELMERWLAAWLYTKADPTYLSKSTGRASGSFAHGLKEPEYYKDAALSLDPSGCLEAILNRKTAGLQWAGKTPTESLAWWERD